MKFICRVVLVSLVLFHNNLKAQTVTASAQREANFLYEVKLIDEFMERFNDDSNSALRKEYRRANRPIPFKRVDLLLSLFDQPVQPKDSIALRFVEQVTDSMYPQFITFKNSNWYIEEKAMFTVGGKPAEITLVLQISLNPDGSSQWMITGINDAPILNEPTDKLVAKEEKPEDAKIQKFISPVDYATNFLELHYILSQGMKPENYFVPQLLATERAKKFILLIKSGKMKFDYSAKVKFHFFQIPNYIFTVERFERQTTHSGWLISSLSTTNAGDKKERIERLLQRKL